jgi:poly(3-hydroxybutyrate) depolymerase
MVKYEIQKRGVNPCKVYVLGASSGARMTNVLMAQYPDMFAAG